MKIIYACRCRYTGLWRDAAESVNSGDVVTYDNVSCGQCSYDGSLFVEHTVDDDFEIPDDGFMPADLPPGAEVYL